MADKRILLLWNSLSDPYDTTELAENFSKIDRHTNEPGRGIREDDIMSMTAKEVEETLDRGHTEMALLKPTGEHFSEVTATLVEYMTSAQLEAAADDLDKKGKDEPERVFYQSLAAMCRRCAEQPERP